MAYTSPRTWVDSEVVSASLLNVHLRDNFLATSVGVVTTKGDLTPASAANTLTRLSVGNDGALLVADSATTPGVRWSSTAKAGAAGFAAGVYPRSQVNAGANNDNLFEMYVQPAFGKGTATGLSAFGIGIWGSGFTTSGTGTIDNAYGLYITAPTIGTANWSLYILNGNSMLGDTSSKVFIGDSANAGMTAGLTINQGAANNEALAVKASYVAHGFTTLWETDTYGALEPQSSTAGGLRISGIADSGAYTGLSLRGFSAAGGDTTKSSIATAAVHIHGYKQSGTTSASLGADENIAAFGSTSVRFILDADGDSHQDVGTAWTNFDDQPDAQRLTELSVLVSRPNDPIRERFGQLLRKANRRKLERLGLVQFNADGHHFVNMSKLTMLNTGAIRQIADEARELRSQVARLTAALRQLPGGAALLKGI